MSSAAHRCCAILGSDTLKIDRTILDSAIEGEVRDVLCTGPPVYIEKLRLFRTVLWVSRVEIIRRKRKALFLHHCNVQCWAWMGNRIEFLGSPKCTVDCTPNPQCTVLSTAPGQRYNVTLAIVFVRPIFSMSVRTNPLGLYRHRAPDRRWRAPWQRL